MATIYAGGSAPELAKEGYRFTGTVDGTDEQILAAYAEQDVCLVRGAAILGNGKDGQWVFGVMARQPARRLLCSCCGAVTRGRQWFNRDSGYGLCVECIDFCHRNETPEQFQSLYGIRGVHFDIQED